MHDDTWNQQPDIEYDMNMKVKGWLSYWDWK